MASSLRAIGGKCRALMAPLKTPSSSSSSTTTATAKPKKIAGATKPSPISPSLSKFIGAPEISRTEAVKKTWEHIKLNNLQNPTNKREIICDEKLKTIFNGKDRVGMLEIAKLLSQHFIKSG